MSLFKRLEKNPLGFLGMTGVPRLQHLPVPATATGSMAVAVPEAGGGQQAKALVPVTPPRATQPHTGRGTAWTGGAGRERIADGTRQSGGRQAAPSDPSAAEGAGGRLVSFSRLSALPFMVQVLGQQAAAGSRLAAVPQTSLAGHRDAALLGSDSYRRAGGEPAVLPDGATFVRLAV
jgi:hypothetical protein